MENLQDPVLKVNKLGINGVNVDKDPLEIGINEVTLAQNAISIITSGREAIGKRPGIVAFTTTATAGDVLGGLDLPLVNLSTLGDVTIYLGRGPIS
jgi:hypothetical protein